MGKRPKENEKGTKNLTPKPPTTERRKNPPDEARTMVLHTPQQRHAPVAIKSLGDNSRTIDTAPKAQPVRGGKDARKTKTKTMASGFEERCNGQKGKRNNRFRRDARRHKKTKRFWTGPPGRRRREDAEKEKEGGGPKDHPPLQ